MKITAIVPWFGGKRTMAPLIIEQLGKHSAYFEPFCGSMAILLSKPVSSHETVNDLHADLITLARVIADETQAAELQNRLTRVLFDERRRKDSVAALKDATDPVDRAFHYFINSWFGRNGFSGTAGCDSTSFAVRWTPNGGAGGQRFASAVDSLPFWHARLRRCTIISRDAFEVIAKIDDHPKTAIYVDPPYIEKNARYKHDFSRQDHARLAEHLARFTRARVVLSYYAHPSLATLYPGWTQLDCTQNKGIHNAGQRGGTGKAAPEVLLINGPAYGGGK